MKFTSLFSVLALSQIAHGALVVQSYDHSPSPNPSYPDIGNVELIDGIADVPTWGGGNSIGAADIGPFVGWLGTDAATTFTFDNTYTVGQVTVWAADSDGAAGVGLPQTIILSDPNSSFTQTFVITNPSGNGNMLPIVMSGFSVVTNQLQISFTRGQEWTMLTEVQFESVPEPSIAILAGTICVFAFRRKR